MRLSKSTKTSRIITVSTDIQMFSVAGAKEHFNQYEMTLLFYTEIHTEKENKQEITVKESILDLTVIVT